MSKSSKDSIARSLEELVKIKETELAIKMENREILNYLADIFLNNIVEEDGMQESYRDDCEDNNECRYGQNNTPFDLDVVDREGEFIQEYLYTNRDFNKTIDFFPSYTTNREVEVDLSSMEVFANLANALKGKYKTSLQKTVMRCISPENYAWILENMYTEVFFSTFRTKNSVYENDENNTFKVMLSRNCGYTAVKDALLSRLVTLLYDQFRECTLEYAIAYFVFAESQRNKAANKD